MTDDYIPAKIFFVSARENGKTARTRFLCEAVIRAEVFQWFDFLKSTVHFISRNEEVPLTEIEKSMLEYELKRSVPTLKVVFDN